MVIWVVKVWRSLSDIYEPVVNDILARSFEVSLRKSCNAALRKRT